jgi:flavoprotein
MSDSTYLSKVSDRIVRMFELYARKIDPEDTRFQEFISNYVAAKGVKNPEAVTYAELYKIVQGGIREFIKQGKEHSRK